MICLNKEDLESFQESMDNLNLLKTKMSENHEIFKLENEGLTKKISELTEELNDNRYQLSELAHIEYDKTGNKKLIGGIGIRITTDLIYEPETAFAWAVKHNLCLSLNKKNFDKIAKAGEIEFVEKSESVTVTFPKEINIEEA